MWPADDGMPVADDSREQPEDAGVVPSLPAELWAHIMDLLEAERSQAATSIAAHFKGFKVRKYNVGCLRYLLKYIRKGHLVACMQGDGGAGKTRAAYWGH